MTTSLKALLLIAAFAFGFWRGMCYSDAHHLAAQAQAATQAMQTERQLAANVHAIDTQLQQEQQRAQTRNRPLLDSLRTGAVRLSIPATACASQTPTTASRDGDQTRAELDPATAEHLVTLTNEGDAAIRQLNACIDAYNEAAQ